MDYEEKDLIIHLSKKVKGIGDVTANSIADFFDCSVKDFLEIGKLDNLKSAKEKRKITDEQIEQLRLIIKEYLGNASSKINELWIRVLIRDFVENSIAELQNTSLSNLLINPFLVKAFGFDNHREVVIFYFYQKVTRSVVTSWGFVSEGLLFCSGAVKSDLAGFDMKVCRNKKQFQLQIKSSPNTMSVEQVRQLNTHILNIKDKRNNIPLLGMTYGTKDQINSQIRGTLIGYPESTLIGKEFWDFIANENGYCERLLVLIDEIMKDEPTKFADELERKTELLIQDWEKEFGKGRKSIEKVLERYL